MRIDKADLEFIREDLISPFGFKGNYLKELWQVVVKLEGEGFTVFSPAVQSVLWADADVFGSAPPAATNALMLAVTSKAISLLQGMDFDTPSEVIEKLVPPLMEYAEKLCGFAVQPTFVQNALVGLDLALWSLYGKVNRVKKFDDIIPKIAKKALSNKSENLVKIPLISYNISMDELKRELDSGTALIKIKIGASTGETKHEDDMRRMLELDKTRLKEIHLASKGYKTPYTTTGNVLYYLDANGRYDNLERIGGLLDFADEIGALERIAVLEEPFAVDSNIDVSSLPVTVAADESAHSLEDVRNRLSLGYKAVALKPIAKTLSISFDMAAEAHKAGAACFCADLTVNPLLTEWNKQFAARLSPLPGMLCGCVEVNGDMNYINWQSLKELLPDGYDYTEEKDGVFPTNKDFFDNGIRLFDQNGYKKIF